MGYLLMANVIRLTKKEKKRVGEIKKFLANVRFLANVKNTPRLLIYTQITNFLAKLTEIHSQLIFKWVKKNILINRYTSKTYTWNHCKN